MSDNVHLPVRAPEVTDETRPFWEATAQGRIDLGVCDSCGFIPWYPRRYCPVCGSSDMTWSTMSGRGTVYSFSVTRAGASRAWKEHLPFVVAYVQLEEGPIMLTNIVDTDPDQVTVGMAVTAVFDDTGEGMSLVRFRPADSPAAC